MWDALSITDNYLDPLGNYSFAIAAPRAMVSILDDRFAKGRLVKFYIDNDQQSVLLITTKQTIIGQAGVTFQVGCRTVLATAYEGSVDPDAVRVYTADTVVTEVINEVMSHYGFDEVIAESENDVSIKTGKPIEGWSDAGWSLEALTHKEAQPHPGETAYSYCSRIFARVGVVMHVNATGELICSRPHYEQSSSYALTCGDSRVDADMMLSEVTISDTNDGQFSEVVLLGEATDKAGQTRANRPVYRAQVGDAIDRNGTPYQDASTEKLRAGRHSYLSDEGAVYKPKIVVDKRTRDASMAKLVAGLAMGTRAANAYQLRCSVDGVRARTGAVWTVNTMVDVSIPILGINEPMFILERQISVSRTGGQVTSLTLIPKYSLVLDAAMAIDSGGTSTAASTGSDARENGTADFKFGLPDWLGTIFS